MSSKKWWATMIKIYGSEEAVREKQRQAGAKAKPSDKPRGFAYDKAHGRDDYVKEMSQKALDVRWHSKPKSP